MSERFSTKVENQRPAFRQEDIKNKDDLRSYTEKLLEWSNEQEREVQEKYVHFAHKSHEVLQSQTEITDEQLHELHDLLPTVEKRERISKEVLQRYYEKVKSHLDSLRKQAGVQHSELYRKSSEKRSDTYAALYGRLQTLGNRIDKLERDDSDPTEVEEVYGELTEYLKQIRRELATKTDEKNLDEETENIETSSDQQSLNASAIESEVSNEKTEVREQLTKAKEQLRLYEESTSKEFLHGLPEYQQLIKGIDAAEQILSGRRREDESVQKLLLEKTVHRLADDFARLKEQVQKRRSGFEDYFGEMAAVRDQMEIEKDTTEASVENKTKKTGYWDKNFRPVDRKNEPDEELNKDTAEEVTHDSSLETKENKFAIREQIREVYSEWRDAKRLHLDLHEQMLLSPRDKELKQKHEAAKQRYNEASRAYFEQLRLAIKERAEKDDVEEGISLGSKFSAMSANHFVLRTVRQELEIEREAMDNSRRGVFTKLTEVFKKNEKVKKGLRWGIATGAVVATVGGALVIMAAKKGTKATLEAVGLGKYANAAVFSLGAAGAAGGAFAGGAFAEHQRKKNQQKFEAKSSTAGETFSAGTIEVLSEELRKYGRTSLKWDRNKKKWVAGGAAIGGAIGLAAGSMIGDDGSVDIGGTEPTLNPHPPEVDVEKAATEESAPSTESTTSEQLPEVDNEEPEPVDNVSAPKPVAETTVEQPTTPTSPETTEATLPDFSAVHEAANSETPELADAPAAEESPAVAEDLPNPEQPLTVPEGSTPSQALWQAYRAGELRGLPEDISRNEFENKMWAAFHAFDNNEAIVMDRMGMETPDVDFIRGGHTFNATPIIEHMNGHSIEEIERGQYSAEDTLSRTGETERATTQVRPQARPESSGLDTEPALNPVTYFEAQPGLDDLTEQKLHTEFDTRVASENVPPEEQEAFAQMLVDRTYIEQRMDDIPVFGEKLPAAEFLQMEAKWSNYDAFSVTTPPFNEDGYQEYLELAKGLQRQGLLIDGESIQTAIEEGIKNDRITVTEDEVLLKRPGAGLRADSTLSIASLSRPTNI